MPLCNVNLSWLHGLEICHRIIKQYKKCEESCEQEDALCTHSRNLQLHMVLNPINKFMELCTKMAKSPTSTMLRREVLQAGTTQGGSVNKVINPNSEKRYK